MKIDKDSAKKFFQSDVDDYKKEFYESGYRSFMSERLNRFIEELEKLNLPEGSKVLDAGCGPGYMTKVVVEKGYSATAFDASPEMLRLTKDLLKSSKNSKQIEFIEGDIEDLPFDSQSYDLIVSAGVIEYLENDNKVLKEFERVLKPNGYLILSSTNKYSPIGIFEPIIENFKRWTITRNCINWILDKIGSTPVRPREFLVRKHAPKELIKNANKFNFQVNKLGFFYGLPWPHPIDRIFPNISNKLGKIIEKTRNTPIRYTFEGLYVVAKKNSD